MEFILEINKSEKTLKFPKVLKNQQVDGFCDESENLYHNVERLKETLQQLCEQYNDKLFIIKNLESSLATKEEVLENLLNEILIGKRKIEKLKLEKDDLRHIIHQMESNQKSEQLSARSESNENDLFWIKKLATERSHYNQKIQTMIEEKNTRNIELETLREELLERKSTLLNQSWCSNDQKKLDLTDNELNDLMISNSLCSTCDNIEIDEINQISRRSSINGSYSCDSYRQHYNEGENHESIILSPTLKEELDACEYKHIGISKTDPYKTINSSDIEDMTKKNSSDLREKAFKLKKYVNILNKQIRLIEPMEIDKLSVFQNKNEKSSRLKYLHHPFNLKKIHLYEGTVKNPISSILESSKRNLSKIFSSVQITFNPNI